MSNFLLAQVERMKEGELKGKERERGRKGKRKRTKIKTSKKEVWGNMFGSKWVRTFPSRVVALPSESKWKKIEEKRKEKEEASKGKLWVNTKVECAIFSSWNTDVRKTKKDQGLGQLPIWRKIFNFHESYCTILLLYWNIRRLIIVEDSIDIGYNI